MIMRERDLNLRYSQQSVTRTDNSYMTFSCIFSRSCTIREVIRANIL